MFVLIASIVSVAFAAVAAVLWWWSAAVKIPKIDSGWGALVGIDEFYEAIGRTARLNKWAASSAGVSAIAQALTFLKG